MKPGRGNWARGVDVERGDGCDCAPESTAQCENMARESVGGTLMAFGLGRGRWKGIGGGGPGCGRGWCAGCEWRSAVAGRSGGWKKHMWGAVAGGRNRLGEQRGSRG